VAYLKKLRDILVFLGIASGRLEEGAMRLEANISLRTPDEAAQGDFRKRAEIKNLNSFDAVLNALEYEVRRQSAAYDQGQPVAQVTMGWDLARGRTVVQRSKEEAQDYRYFPEPDLPPLRFTTGEIEAVRGELPELRHGIVERYQRDLGLDSYRAELLAQTRSFSEYFEAALARFNNVERLANLLLGDFMAQINERIDLDLEDTDAWPVRPEEVAELARQWEAGEVTGPHVKQLLPTMFATGQTVEQAKAALGIEVVGGEDALGPVIDQVLADNQDAVEKVQSGNTKVVAFLVGQVMKATRGQADPKEAGRLLSEKLGL
jgi:aspartyl-tRNA(Asn)/glutamyl-tRNA(Gln) amidotransferase subunit B